MKTLKNQTLLYDENCPLCNLYTTGFIKAGMLDKSGKKPFSNLNNEEYNFINIERASNEIALVDNENKTVLYGIDSLLRVIGNSFPWMERVGNFTPIKFLLKKLYSFISYNRKVIIPSKKSNDKLLQCVPSFNFKYRTLYIVFTIFVTALTLYNYSELIQNLPNGNFSRELILAFGQILFQCIFLLKLDSKTMLNYIGNLMTVSLLGSLILTPILILNQFTTIPEVILLGWFGITVLLMFIEHYRRIKLLELPSYLCITWVIYRIIALILILNL